MNSPYNRVERRVGKFDWAHPHEDMVSYDFYLRDGAPKLQGSFLLALSEESNYMDVRSMTVLEVAEAIDHVLARYLWHSDSKKAAALVAYLKTSVKADTLARIEVERKRYEDTFTRWLQLVEDTEAEGEATPDAR